ncbi:MAG: hypothetical protein ABOK23_09620 [Candidatus Methanoperedens sp.]|nr:hypothetical protein [Candidatus Methanoperedens sp.]
MSILGISEDQSLGGGYAFRFVYPAIYNTNLSQWHPISTGSRNFISDYLYVGIAAAPMKVRVILESTIHQSKRKGYI